MERAEEVQAPRIDKARLHSQINFIPNAIGSWVGLVDRLWRYGTFNNGKALLRTINFRLHP